MNSKSQIRSDMKTLLKSLPNKSERSLKILECIRPYFKQGMIVSCFVPLEDEVDLSVLHDISQELNLSYVVPEFENHRPDGRIQFRAWSSLSSYEKTPGGWMHPVDGAVFYMDDIDLILVPGLAFTDEGHRLGRGGGFYDRLLQQYFGKSIGVCFKEQLLDELPFENHDQMVDTVVSC